MIVPEVFMPLEAATNVIDTNEFEGNRATICQRGCVTPRLLNLFERC